MADAYQGHNLTETPQDREHLNLLSICYYVAAGLGALCSCFPCFHVFMGFTMLSGGMIPSQSGQFGAPPQAQAMSSAMAIMFIAMGAALILLGWAFSAAVFYAGASLRRRRYHTFCFVMACLCCFQVPVGTALGVFTIIVLMRPTVKAAFGAGVPARLP
ncbi:hypothetical protein HZA57_03410 [Candidatus Poribacteria bacterium]|nr:hypothetical protein [Candidatus Poribacteria bacterium]